MLIQLHPFQKFQTTPRQFLMEVVFPPALALPTGHKLLGGLPYRVLFLGISTHGVLSEMSLEISNSLWIELWSTMHLLLIQLRLLVAGTTDCLSLKVQLSANILIAYYQILLVDKNIYILSQSSLISMNVYFYHTHIFPFLVSVPIAFYVKCFSRLTIPCGSKCGLQ